MPKENPAFCHLDRCVLCKTCGPHWTQRIMAHREVLRFEKGETIFTEGKAIHGLYFIYDGAVKVHQSWGPGNEFILRFAVEGDMLGHRAQGNTSASPITATALEQSTICHISPAFLEATMNENPSFVRTMMLLYVAELQKAEIRIRNMATMPVKSRVAEALFVLRDTLGSDTEGYFRIPVTRIDIASYAGTTYEAVFRLLSTWASQGLVSTAGKKIRIDNEEELNAIIHNSTP